MIIWYFRLLKTCLSPEKCQAAWLETLTKDDHVYNQLVFIFKSSTSGKLTLICSFTLNDLIVHNIGIILRIWGIMLAVQFCILLCYSFMHLKISRLMFILMLFLLLIYVWQSLLFLLICIDMLQEHYYRMPVILWILC